MITVTFACGHRAEVSADHDPSLRCHCGETRVQRVKAPVPTFRGFCVGPHATRVHLDPIVKES